MKYKQIWKTAAACLMAAVMLPGCSDEEGGGTVTPEDGYATLAISFYSVNSSEPVGTRAPGDPENTVEEENDYDYQHEGFVHSTFNLADRGADEFRVVESVVVVNVLRKVFLHGFHTFIYSVGYVNMVCTRLWNNNNTDHRHTVHFHVALEVGRTKFCTSDVAETYDLIVFFLYYDIIEFFRRVHQTQSSDCQLSSVSFNTA